MLTADILQQSNLNLTEDQIKAIAILSKNDEDAQFDTRNKQSRVYEITSKLTEQIHGGYDKDILEITGLAKPANKRTYEHLKEVLKDAWTAKVSVDKLTKERDDLKAKVASGGSIDEDLKAEYLRQIEDKQGEIDALGTQIAKLKEEHEAEVGKVTSEMRRTTLSAELDKIQSELQFIDTIPESVLNDTINSRREQIMQGVEKSTMKGENGEVPVLRDKDGQILRDAANGMQPHTMATYYSSKIQDLIDVKKVVTGGGVKPGGKVATGGPLKLDLSTAKTQMEASKMTQDYILQSGIKKTSPEFGDMQREIYQKNKEAGNDIMELPMRTAPTE